MATLENRITALEQRAEVNEHAVFFEVHFDDRDEPALGWFFYRDGARVDILRQGDETDAGLRERAANACRAGNCPMMLFEIDPDLVNHYGFILPHVMEPEAWEAAAVKQQAAITQA